MTKIDFAKELILQGAKENSRSGVSVATSLGLAELMMEEFGSPNTAVIVLHWDPEAGESTKKEERTGL